MMNQSIKTALFIFFMGLNLFAPQIFAADAYDLPKVVAVENRMYQVKHDITPEIGYLPVDAFNKSVTLGLSYTYNFSSSQGWEVINASVASNQASSIKKELLNFGATVPEAYLDAYKWMATSSYVFTPFYSKNLLFNKDTIFSETSFLATGGLLGFNSGQTAQMVGAGIQFRFFSSESFSWKFKFSTLYHNAPGKSSNVIMSLNIGLSFLFGSVKGGP